MHATLPLLQDTDFPPIKRGKLTTLQVNVGYLCNQSCLHCHVNAGPTRTEIMTRDNIDHIIAFLGNSGVTTLDITGGAPELNPHFRDLVRAARALKIEVIDRCNLTIFEQPGHADTAEFLAAQGVHVTASLPCYLEDNVEQQRGKGVFGASIRGLQKLNALGYAQPGSGLTLNLVYNPQGPSLPPPQQALEADYRKHISEHYDVMFNHLHTITNMPIQRFGSTLISKNQFHDYMDLLRGAYQESNLNAVMCRSLISVDWQGYVYDCDFNQMLNLPLRLSTKPRAHITDLMNRDITGRPIVVKDHCYGCTAGQGSSCGGALTD